MRNVNYVTAIVGIPEWERVSMRTNILIYATAKTSIPSQSLVPVLITEREQSTDTTRKITEHSQSAVVIKNKNKKTKHLKTNKQNKQSLV